MRAIKNQTGKQESEIIFNFIFILDIFEKRRSENYIPPLNFRHPDPWKKEMC